MVSTQAQIAAQNAATMEAIRAGTTKTQTASQASASSLGSNMTTFLTLLTKQLQNQDPLSPMDTADFTNQLVLYTQAEQQIKTNSMLENLIALNKGTIGTQALGYIGKDVSFASDALYVESEGEAQSFYYSLESAAGQMTLNIVDADGNTVRALEGELGAGAHKISWDGKNNEGVAVEPGDYKIVAAAIGADNKPVKTGTLVNGRVIGLESDGAGSINLVLSGDRSLSLSSILSVQERPSPSTSQQNS